MKKNRLLSLLLTLALAFSLAAPAAAYNTKNLIPQKKTYQTAFTDTKGTWCDSAVQTCYEAGLLDGKSATSFAPKDSLTYAQITVITARLANLLAGGTGVFDAPADGEAWYQPAVDYLTAVLEQRQDENAAVDYLLSNIYYMEGYAQTPCYRYDFAWYLTAILPESALTPINHITALPDELDPDVLRLYNAGILTGSDAYGTFRGTDTLNRGQAAAMLARIIDPAQRVSFTPKELVYSQEILGLAPEIPLLSVDGYSVSAEVYAYYLTQNISIMQMERYFSFFDTYPDQFMAYLSDESYTDFGEFMLAKYGVDINAPIAWNTPDKGGLTPAQKVREDTLQDITQLAVLMNREKSYPLTAEQKASVSESSWLYYGFTKSFVQTIDTSLFIQENLTNSFSLSAADLEGYLRESGYLYGSCVIIYRGEEGRFESDAEALSAAETARSQMSAHRSDPEYLAYLLWKYSDNYTTEPSLLSTDELSLENRQALEQLATNQVSAVLEESDRYVVVLKMDPSADAYVSESAAAIPAAAQIDEWAQSAKVTFTAAYDAVDVAKAAAAYLALNF